MNSFILHFFLLWSLSYSNALLEFDLHSKSTLNDKGHKAQEVSLSDGKRFDVCFVDPAKANLRFYHTLIGNNEKVETISRLKSNLEQQGQHLYFATNGGMYKPNLEPLGLFIEEGLVRYPLNLDQGGPEFTNFYSIPPNGVFYIKQDQQFGIVPREAFPNVSNVKYATQSGPMILMDKEINPAFDINSQSKYIRTGVGITRKGLLMFAISKQPETLFHFARIFKFYGCKEALYLDGAVSEMYLDYPDFKRIQTYNQFATIIAISEKK